jgi:hypothetical protein
MSHARKKFVAGGVALVAAAVWVGVLLGGHRERPELIMTETPAELASSRDVGRNR